MHVLQNVFCKVNLTMRYCWKKHFHFFKFKYLKILQCSVGFCHTGMHISHNYTYISSLHSIPLLPSSYPSRSSQSTRPGFLCLYSIYSLALYNLDGKLCYKSVRMKRLASIIGWKDIHWLSLTPGLWNAD